MAAKVCCAAASSACTAANRRAGSASVSFGLPLNHFDSMA